MLRRIWRRLAVRLALRLLSTDRSPLNGYIIEDRGGTFFLAQWFEIPKDSRSRNGTAVKLTGLNTLPAESMDISVGGYRCTWDIQAERWRSVEMERQ